MHAAPGDLLHLDIKKLGRIVRPLHRVTGNRRDHVKCAGWEYVHVAIDDHPRVATSSIHPDQKRSSTEEPRCTPLSTGMPARASALKAVLTDKGQSYCSLQFAQACPQFGLK